MGKAQATMRIAAAFAATAWLPFTLTGAAASAPHPYVFGPFGWSGKVQFEYHQVIQRTGNNGYTETLHVDELGSATVSENGTAAVRGTFSIMSRETFGDTCRTSVLGATTPMTVVHEYQWHAQLEGPGRFEAAKGGGND